MSLSIKMTEIFQDCRALQISTPGAVAADLQVLGFNIINDL